jgi:hypothetical protein
MPTKREREYYAMGFRDGVRSEKTLPHEGYGESSATLLSRGLPRQPRATAYRRKLSAWQKYIKNKRNHIKYRDGKLNLKAMGVQYRKKKRR